MMKLKIYLPVLAIVFLASCSDEKVGSDLDNPSEQINSIAGELNDDVVTMVQSEGVDGALSLLDLLENSEELGRVSAYQTDENRAFVSNQIAKVSHTFAKGVTALVNDEPEDFEDVKGVYEWNFELEDFKFIEDSDFVVIAFPTEGSTTNNAEFRLTEFTVIEIDEDELPTVIKADLTVDEVKYIDLDFVVNYDADGNPESADIYLEVLPFVLDVRFDDSETSTTSLAVTLLHEGENLVGIDVDVAFDSDEKLEPTAISGEVSYRNLRIVGSVSDTEMDESEEGDPNDYIDLDLFIGDDKAGDIVFVVEEIEEEGEVYEEYIAYVEYADGTRENLEDILQPVIDEIDSVLEDID